MRKTYRVWIALFLLPTLAMFCAFYMVPLLTVLVTGFADWNGFDPVKMIGFANYKEIFLQDDTFWTALVNTLWWGMIAAFIHVPFGVFVALILHRKPFGWKFVRSVALIPSIISSAVMAILYVFIYNPGMGLLNSLIRVFGFKDFEINWLYDPSTAFLSVTVTWLFFAGVIMLITMAELSSIPPSLQEAAKIDGASDFKIDLHIHLPLLRGIIGTGVILAVTSVFKAFDVIYLTTGGGPGDSTTNIALMLYNQVAIHYRYGYSNALGTVLLFLGIFAILLINQVFRPDKTSLQ